VAAVNRNKQIVFTDNPRVKNTALTRSRKQGLYGNMYGNTLKAHQTNFEEQEFSGED